MALTVAKTRAATKPGRYGDGDGLYLNVSKAGTRSWVQRIVIEGRRRDLGLGRYPDVTLNMARSKAMGNRRSLDSGVNPLAVEEERPPVPTFRDVAERYVMANEPTWRHPKTANDTRASLGTYAYPPIGDTPVDRITRADVLDILEPVWTAKPACSRKLRQRVRAVFAYAMARGLIDVNPAGEVIDAALPATPAVTSHFRALPYQDVPDALAVVGGSTAGLAARLCFRWMVLTAARSGEARGARWVDVDLEARTWTIPGTMMKSGREHRVPLSEQALEILEQARVLEDRSGLVFPSSRGKKLSDMTLTKVLRDNGLSDRATAHGFRTSFKVWCMEVADVSWAVGEAALAHTLGNSTEQAYARSDLFQRRRELMDSWGLYVVG